MFTVGIQRFYSTHTTVAIEELSNTYRLNPTLLFVTCNHRKWGTTQCLPQESNGSIRHIYNTVASEELHYIPLESNGTRPPFKTEALPSKYRCNPTNGATRHIPPLQLRKCPILFPLESNGTIRHISLRSPSECFTGLSVQHFSKVSHFSG